MKKNLFDTFNSSIKISKSYLILCIVLFPLVVFFSFSKPWETSYDYWEIAASVRELSINPFHPNNPMVMLPGNTSSRFVPYTIFWGLFKKVTNLGIFATMGIAAIVNYFIFIVGLYRFVSIQFRNTSLATYVFLTMLLIWGSGYGYANAYHLEMFLITMPYIGFFSFALSLNSLYYLSSYCEGNKKHDFFLYASLSIIVFVTHPITGAFCFIAALAILLETGNLKKLFLSQSVPLVALGISVIWPYFSYWDVFTKGSIQISTKSVFFSRQLGALGLSIIGFPIMILYILRKKYLFFFYGFLFCSLIYIISYFADISIGGRFILFMVFFLHLALAIYVKENNVINLQKIKASLKANGSAIILIFLLLVPSGYYRIKEMSKHILRFFDRPLHIHSYNSPVKPYLFLSSYLSYPDIVIVDADEGGTVPAITGARVVEPYLTLQFLIMDEVIKRKRDVEAFFKSHLLLKERTNIISKYNVTHIMINLKNEEDWHPSFIENLKVIGRKIVRENTIELYEVVTP